MDYRRVKRVPCTFPVFSGYSVFCTLRCNLNKIFSYSSFFFLFVSDLPCCLEVSDSYHKGSTRPESEPQRVSISNVPNTKIGKGYLVTVRSPCPSTRTYVRGPRVFTWRLLYLELSESSWSRNFGSYLSTITVLVLVRVKNIKTLLSFFKFGFVKVVSLSPFFFTTF